MSNNPTPFEILTSLSELFSERCMIEFITDYIRRNFDTEQIADLLDSVEYKPEELNGGELMEELNNTIKELKEFIKLQNHGALEPKPINIICTYPDCKNDIYNRGPVWPPTQVTCSTSSIFDED